MLHSVTLTFLKKFFLTFSRSIFLLRFKSILFFLNICPKIYKRLIYYIYIGIFFSDFDKKYTYSYRILLTPFLLVSVKSVAKDDLDRFNDPEIII